MDPTDPPPGSLGSPPPVGDAGLSWERPGGGPELGPALTGTARRALARAFARPLPALVAHDALDERGATFVTLTQRGELRGCIGTLEAQRSLKDDVEHNALAAAFHDPRFAPLADNEFDITRIEISLLSPPVPMPIAGEGDLLARLHPGVDGVVLSWRGRRATFLPQVWQALPVPRDFIAALKKKAGLDAQAWDDEMTVARYTVAKFVESDADGP
jgi:AmmeMemoRadiSam system protein A